MTFPSLVFLLFRYCSYLFLLFPGTVPPPPFIQGAGTVHYCSGTGDLRVMVAATRPEGFTGRQGAKEAVCSRT